MRSRTSHLPHPRVAWFPSMFQWSPLEHSSAGKLTSLGGSELLGWGQGCWTSCTEEPLGPIVNQEEPQGVQLETWQGSIIYPGVCQSTRQPERPPPAFLGSVASWAFLSNSMARFPAITSALRAPSLGKGLTCHHNSVATCAGTVGRPDPRPRLSRLHLLLPGTQARLLKTMTMSLVSSCDAEPG